ncbi:F-box and WD repeat domain containing 4 L homeolog precursor [Xenopus laevis]|uniref:F-box/WD repeat-containing protein 4 n=1 Tax=Xenopus laevis TaxID=8355 RepID=A2RRT5_XENLA|nr:F-box and WD repeat domain containing 4 L homeolog precursor [Xenopus laevis]AAI31842.1 LOC100037117 protein [Xenopus laevis]
MWPHLLHLPEEILLLLFSYLDAQALGRLAQVCRKLQHFTSKDAVWRKIAKKCLNSGFVQQGTDVASWIPVKERVRVSQNWKNGRCRRNILLKWKRNLMPWIHLDGNILYLSQAEKITAHKLCSNSNGVHRQPFAVFLNHREDVCRFVLNNSHIISGGGDGRIAIHKVHSAFSIHFTAHDQDVNCVDCHRGIIVSGSRDRTAKVWSISPSRAGHCLHTIQTDDRVWSVAINPTLSSFITGTACCGHTSPLRIWDLQSSFITGTACCGHTSPLRIWDLQSGQLMTCLGTDFRRGAGVLDVRYETPYTLLSCGYDTFIRYWDLRTSTRRCVKEWEEPHDSALYCMQSDGNHMIVSGSAYYGVVRLWDKRMNQCLQSFSLSSPTSSPVYCLQFNTRHLYAALASALHLLDFTSGESLFRAL